MFRILKNKEDLRKVEYFLVTLPLLQDADYFLHLKQQFPSYPRRYHSTCGEEDVRIEVGRITIVVSRSTCSVS